MSFRLHYHVFELQPRYADGEPVFVLREVTGWYNTQEEAHKAGVDLLFEGQQFVVLPVGWGSGVGR